MNEKSIKFRRALRTKRKLEELGFEDIFQLISSYIIYKGRIQEIEKIKHEIPEPTKTKIINILANGKPSL